MHTAYGRSAIPCYFFMSDKTYAAYQPSTTFSAKPTDLDILSASKMIGKQHPDTVIEKLIFRNVLSILPPSNLTGFGEISNDYFVINLLYLTDRKILCTYRTSSRA